jgi:hypothetical protein
VYIFYVDESGRPSLEDKALEADPWFVMAAVGIRADQWLAIDDRITQLKRTYFPAIKPLKIEFKSTSIRAYGGAHPRWPFSGLSREQMVALVEELYAIYDTWQPPLFTVTIFNVSQYSQMLTLPDLVAYNVYHRFRYDKPDYPFYQRIKPLLYRRFGLWGYGLKVFTDWMLET